MRRHLRPPARRPGRAVPSRYALLALLGLALALGSCRARPRPNLVLVVIDTLRQDHLPCYGYERQTAPTLCRLAAEGARLDGISPSSWTKPATASILTGMHPLRLQVLERSDRLPEAALGLAELLSAHGYQTIGLSGNGWIQERFGFEQGFDELNFEIHEIRQPPTAKEINARLAARLPNLRQPYFLYLHYVDPHEPYAPALGWDGKPLDERLAARGPISDDQLRLQSFMRRDPQLLRDAVALYDGEIRAADDGLAAALELLAGAGLMANTLLVVTSDHGEEFEDHDRGGHGLTLHREVTRVPLVLHAPGRVAAGVTPGAAGLVDVVPTVLDLLGVAAPREHSFDGVSQAAALTGERPREAAPAERDFLLHLDLDSRAAVGLLRGSRKLLLSGHPYRKQLFDHAADPRERVNLLEQEGASGDFPQLARRLAESYNDLLRRAYDHETTAIDEELARRIHALGYVAPSPNQLYDRTLPERLRPADTLEGGLLGWEKLGALAPCIEMADPDDFHQLLEGWRFVELDGRWALDKASALLAVPSPAATHALTFNGVNYRGAPFTLVAQIDGREIFRRVIPHGAFRFWESVPGELLTGRYAVLRLVSQPAFLPPERPDWQWHLGVFLHSICLAATPAAASAT